MGRPKSADPAKPTTISMREGDRELLEGLARSLGVDRSEAVRRAVLATHVLLRGSAALERAPVAAPAPAPATPAMGPAQMLEIERSVFRAMTMEELREAWNARPHLGRAPRKRDELEQRLAADNLAVWTARNASTARTAASSSNSTRRKPAARAAAAADEWSLPPGGEVPDATEHAVLLEAPLPGLPLVSMPRRVSAAAVDAYAGPRAAALKDWAARLRDAAAKVGPDGRFGAEKVFLAAAAGRMEVKDRADFGARLLAARREGLVKLARADVVEVMDPELVRQSEMFGPWGEELHFLVLPQGTR